MKSLMILVAFLLSSVSFAGTARVLDGSQITNGSATINIPSSGGAQTALTTSSTIDGVQLQSASVNMTSAPTGVLPVGNAGLGVANPTAGSVIIGNGSSPVSLIAPSSTGNVLTSNGTTWVSSAPVSPTLINGTSALPQSVTAVGGISLSAPTSFNVVYVAGSAGAVTVTATPSITACTAEGQVLYVRGADGTNTVTLQDESGLVGSKLRLNGNWVSGAHNTLFLLCDNSTSEWVEIARQ